MTDMDIQMWEDYEKKLQPVMAGLEQALDPRDLQAELDQDLEVTRRVLRDQPGALAKAEDLATERVAGLRATSASRAAYTVDMTAHVLEQHIAPLVQAAEAAPTPAQAWKERTGKAASEAEQLQLASLHEQRLARFEQESPTATVASTLAQYQAALREPFEPLNASRIGWVEARHAAGWRGKALTPDEALNGDVKKLQAAIRSAQVARRPQGATKALEALAKAKQLVQRAEQSRVGRFRVRKEVTSAWKDLVA
jgi:hypothetical protein